MTHTVTFSTVALALFQRFGFDFSMPYGTCTYLYTLLPHYRILPRENQELFFATRSLHEINAGVST